YDKAKAIYEEYFADYDENRTVVDDEGTHYYKTNGEEIVGYGEAYWKLLTLDQLVNVLTGALAVV
ncbi:MAG: hypothetical protein MJ072_03940, partial [Clostridia bacterium]|nr:hypothetical protein [Clostridia bacterium]